MNTDRSKIQQESDQRVFARPKKPVNPQQEQEQVKGALNLNNEELLQSVWGRFALFCNESYKKFIPQNSTKRKNQEEIAPIQKKCVLVLLEQREVSDWELLLSKFTNQEYKTAERFFFHFSRKYSESPQQLIKSWQSKIKKFVELAEYALIRSEHRDFVKIEEFSDIVDDFNNSEERTFMFLYQLPDFLDEDARNIVESSDGYQQILKWGASRFLNNFGLQLQERFRVTRTAIKDEAAQNLARELGETEVSMRNQLQILLAENQELKQNIEQIRSSSFQEAVYQFAKLLQDQPQPVLEQIFGLHKRLNELAESEVSLSNDILTCLNTLESLLKAFKAIKLVQFPEYVDESFELKAEDLDNFTYAAGSAFSDERDKKKVRCISPGWRVGERVITPGRVQEITEAN